MTETEIVPSSPGRKGGAPPGNTNALKHGFYSRLFTRSESSRLDSDVKGEFHDEEALLRVLIVRAVESMRSHKSPPEWMFTALRSITLAVGRIESLHRSRKLIYDSETTIEKALDELKYIPFEED